MNSDDLDRNLAWLEDADNQRKYAGLWVVLQAGRYVDSGDNFARLYHEHGDLLNTGKWITKVGHKHWQEKKRKWEAENK